MPPLPLPLALASAAFGVAGWAGGMLLLRVLKRVRPAPLFALGAALAPPTVAAAGALLGVAGTANHLPAVVYATAAAAAVDAAVMASPAARKALYDTDGDAATVKQCAALLWGVATLLLAVCVMT